MNRILIVLFLAIGLTSQAQERREDGTLYDGNLTFQVVEENLRNEGTMLVCILNEANGRCVQNLIAPFEVLVYNQNDEQIWNSLWTGQNMDLKFRVPMRGAKYVIIQARADFVVNSRTGTRIYTDGPMTVKYELE